MIIQKDKLHANDHLDGSAFCKDTMNCLGKGIKIVAFPNRKSYFFDNKLEFSVTKLAES